MSQLPRVLVLLGSGETAPAMRALHASLLDRMPVDRPRLLLETTYGFQANEPEMTAKLLEWFAVNVGRPLQPAGLPRLDGADVLARERGLARLSEAAYVLAGPGSPSFAMRQWQGSPVRDRLAAMLTDGGMVVLSSAASLTAGAWTLPVYEIYKAGEDPFWLPGMDLLGLIGIRAAVVAHYDNAEGGGHDTRFCYMGEQRIRALEAMLPDDAGLLGIDELTTLVLDLDEDMASVIGRGGVTWRLGGVVRRFEPGTVAPLSDFRHGEGVPVRPGEAPVVDVPGHEREQFRDAMAVGEIDRAAAAALALETRTAVDPGESGRAMLRAMIADLADAASVPVDPRAIAAPFVEALLAVRGAVRAEQRWDFSDLIRDRLKAAGVTVRDTPNGPVWDLDA